MIHMVCITSIFLMADDSPHPGNPGPKPPTPAPGDGGDSGGNG